jgi:hypothetical protein
MPLEQLNNPLTFYAFFLASKQGKTGLTVTVDVYDPTFTRIVTAAAAIEVGGGLYTYTLPGANVTIEKGYVAIFKTADATVDVQHIPALWEVGVGGIENLVAGGVVSVVGPVPLGGNITIVRGDEYNNADGRALEWSTVAATDWPDLTGATIVLTARNSSGGTLTKAGSVVTPGGVNKKVRVELVAADTSGLTLGLNEYSFDIQATLSPSGRKVTLVRGFITVLADYSP